MSLYTHWVCFDCRKSFHERPLDERKCPECARAMIDMGVYFEPPRRQAVKAWEIVQLIADAGYRYNNEGTKAFIDSFILVSKRPSVAEVKNNIEAHRR